MTHSVILTTPPLTLDEISEFYGLSKEDEKFVDSLFEAGKSRTSPAPQHGARAARAGNSLSNGSGRARKTKTRAPKAA